MAERLADRIGVITGGASGIGAECARRFVAEGARVVLGDRNADGLDAMAKELGPDACATEIVDVTVPADLDRLVARATESFGAPNLAFNAAGVGWLSPVHQHPIEQWDMVIDVCLRGVFLAMRRRACRPTARPSGRRHADALCGDGTRTAWDSCRWHCARIHRDADD